MRVKVWVDAWQMQCCGVPFAVGEPVTWTLASGCDADHLRAVVGCPLADEIGFSEEHHDELPADSPATSGRVLAIQAWHCRFGPQDDLRTLHPVAGSGRPVPVTSADGWEQEVSGVLFQGYVVDLEV